MNYFIHRQFSCVNIQRQLCKKQRMMRTGNTKKRRWENYYFCGFHLVHNQTTNEKIEWENDERQEFVQSQQLIAIFWKHWPIRHRFLFSFPHFYSVFSDSMELICDHKVGRLNLNTCVKCRNHFFSWFENWIK